MTLFLNKIKKYLLKKENTCLIDIKATRVGQKRYFFHRRVSFGKVHEYGFRKTVHGILIILHDVNCSQFYNVISRI